MLLREHRDDVVALPMGAIPNSIAGRIVRNTPSRFAKREVVSSYINSLSFLCRRMIYRKDWKISPSIPKVSPYHVINLHSSMNQEIWEYQKNPIGIL